MISILQKEDNDTNFLIYDVETSVINSFRRIMMADYLNHGFNEKNITCEINTSSLHNEIVRHRLSLVPIHTEDGIKITIDMKNNNKEIMNVYSDDIKIINGKGKIMKGILLFKLKENQHIKISAFSTKSTSKIDGIPHRPITSSHFRIVKELFISSKVNQKSKEEIKEYFIENYELVHNNIKNTKNNYNSLGFLYTIRDNTKVIEKIIKRFDLGEKDIYIEDMKYNNNFVYSFTIESLFIDPVIILKNTINILIKQFETFLESEMEVEEDDHFIKLFIKNGTYTIANTLSCFLRKNNEIKFAHYNKLHPLDDFLIIQISLHNKNINYIEILQNTLENINKYIVNIQKLDIFK